MTFALALQVVGLALLAVAAVLLFGVVGMAGAGAVLLIGGVVLEAKSAEGAPSGDS